jgi:hypothetical protein
MVHGSGVQGFGGSGNAATSAFESVTVKITSETLNPEP